MLTASAQSSSFPPLETSRFVSGLHTSSVVAAIRLSVDGRITYANRAMLALLKVDSLASVEGKSFEQEFMRDPREWAVWSVVTELGVLHSLETCCTDVHGDEVFLKGDLWVEKEGTDGADHIAGIFTDVSATHHLHRGLQKVARFEAIGGLTIGIIHDVNNILTVLQGNLYLAGDSLRSAPTAYEKVKRARDAAKRGGELTRQLLSFARGQDMESSIVDPRKLVQTLAPLLSRAVGPGIALRTAADETVKLVHANEAQLQSALVNLAINARDAIESEGIILIRASNVLVSERKSKTLGVRPGEFVQISVLDNGPGIPADIQAQVFEPFFSTKGAGRGTGLGLSMVRWLCEQAGGTVTLSSREGRGTIVSMILPCSAQQATDTTQKTMPLSALPSGSEMILLLSADEQMHWMVTQILETLGYSVCATSTADQAHAAIESRSPELVIVDGSAAGNDGLAALVDGIRARAPEVAAIAMLDSDLPELLPRARVLTRPFSPFDLATIVRRTLDGVDDV